MVPDRVILEARYIAGDNPGAADAWTKDLFVKVNRLRAFPMSGRVVSERRRADTLIYLSSRSLVKLIVPESRCRVTAVASTL